VDPIIIRNDDAGMKDKAEGMMIAIPDVLDAAGVARLRTIVDAAEWIDGNATSGHQSAFAKRNRQLPEDSAAAREAGGVVLAALGLSPLFFAAALPLKVFPPLFNAYEGGEAFATHVDNAVRIKRGSDFRLRSDLSATLFLEDPDAYDGGELVVETQFGAQAAKLPAGHVLLYPSSSLHRVEPVTRGRRVASFFWIQSMVRDTEARRTLFELDTAIQTVARDRGQDDAAVIQLTGVYHNLLRKWADS
jgi:PKHD-type hydroxylase